jgi:hypothetical protein
MSAVGQFDTRAEQADPPDMSPFGPAGQNESPALPDLSRIATQVAAKGRARAGRNTGVFMSGHLRFCFAAFLLLADLSTSPASSNPFAAFLGQAAPVEATAPASAEKECLSQPGKSAAEGQHWVYRFDGHRKCWFQAAEGTPMAKKSVHHHAAKENEATPRKRKAVVDARAELLRSAPAETPQPAPPAPGLKVVDATPVRAAGAAALVPPAPDIAKPATDQLTPENPTPRQVDVETLLAAAPAASDAVAASVPPATPVAVPIAEAGDDGPGWTATWLGVLLMALGFVFLLGASRTLRGACWPSDRSGDFSIGGRDRRPSRTTIRNRLSPSGGTRSISRRPSRRLAFVAEEHATK